ncbi:MAG TPA: lysophospholipid acyltransferase family protein [Burkholderiales bacterium]|nr:lysophospholipid acyltransferase family protein [Burkholderiales bacterium]
MGKPESAPFNHMTAPVSATPFIGKPLDFLWGIGADLAIFFVTLFWGTLAIVLMLISGRGWAADMFAPIWSRWILKACGIRVEIEGLQHIDRKRSYVLISNHLSNFDIWVILAALPLPIRFVAKKELLRVPVFGQALALSNHIVIDRSNPDAAIARINARVAANAAEPFCILFFAEGTRSPDGGVHAFKKGGVTLAIRTSLPIVPVSISGTRKFLPKRRAIIRPRGRVKIVLDIPIETHSFRVEARDALNERVRAVVIKNYVEEF